MHYRKGFIGKAFEHKTEAPLSPAHFRHRLLRYLSGAMGLILIALLIGMLGYHHFEQLDWVDAFLNASMILGGMGPVNILTTVQGKLFAGFYALFSGVLFLVVAGLLFGPLFHRVLHHFHFDPDMVEETGNE